MYYFDLRGLCHNPDSRCSAVSRLLIAAGTTVVISGCGLSSEDLASYKTEIKYAESRVKSAQKYTARLIELNERAQATGYVESRSFKEAEESMKSSMAFISYGSCLDAYMRAKEGFVKAKTSCTLESGIKDL